MTKDDNYDGKSSQMTKEEMEKHLARVTAPHQPVERRDPFPVCPTITLPSEEIDKMTERLYTQSIEQKKESMKELDTRTYQAPKKQTLTFTELCESVERLYTQSIEKKNANLEESRRRYLHHREENTTKVPLKQYVQDMYTNQIEAQKKKEQRLHDKYIAPTDIPKTSLSRSRISAASDRLSTKG